MKKSEKNEQVPMSDAMKNKARLALSGGRDIDRCLQTLPMINNISDVQIVHRFITKENLSKRHKNKRKT